MRIINFRDGILYPIAYLLGLKPGSTLSVEKTEALVNYVNRRLEGYWDRADFPEWIVTEPRIPGPDHVVAWEQPGQTVIEKIFRVYLSDPDLYPAAAMDTPFHLRASGIYVGLEHGTRVWIKYMPRPDSWTTGPLYDSDLAYGAGITVYDLASGDCYQALTAIAAGADPLTDAGKWRRLQFPYALASPVRHGAFSDALREDGQNDKAAEEEKMAEMEFFKAAGVLARTNADTLTDQETAPARYHGPLIASGGQG